jgi:hypothetical protein
MSRTVNIPENFNLVRGNATNGKVKGRSYAYFIYGNNAKNLVTNAYTKYEGDKLHFYSTKKNLKLVDMSNVKSVLYLMAYGNNSVKTSLDKAFRIVNNKVYRKSKLHHDLAVSRLICSLGMDGYIAPRMIKRKGGGTFHQEIMLCKPDEKVNLVKSETPLKALNPSSKRMSQTATYTFNNSNNSNNNGATPPKRPRNNNNGATPPKRPRNNNNNGATPPKRPRININGAMPRKLF